MSKSELFEAGREADALTKIAIRMASADAAARIDKVTTSLKLDGSGFQLMAQLVDGTEITVEGDDMKAALLQLTQLILAVEMIEIKPKRTTREDAKRLAAEAAQLILTLAPESFKHVKGIMLDSTSGISPLVMTVLFDAEETDILVGGDKPSDLLEGLTMVLAVRAS